MIKGFEVKRVGLFTTTIIVERVLQQRPINFIQ